MPGRHERLGRRHQRERDASRSPTTSSRAPGQLSAGQLNRRSLVHLRQRAGDGGTGATIHAVCARTTTTRSSRHGSAFFDSPMTTRPAGRLLRGRARSWSESVAPLTDAAGRARDDLRRRQPRRPEPQRSTTARRSPSTTSGRPRRLTPRPTRSARRTRGTKRDSRRSLRHDATPFASAVASLALLLAPGAAARPAADAARRVPRGARGVLGLGARGVRDRARGAGGRRAHGRARAPDDARGGARRRALAGRLLLQGRRRGRPGPRRRRHGRRASRRGRERRSRGRWRAATRASSATR